MDIDYVDLFCSWGGYFMGNAHDIFLISIVFHTQVQGALATAILIHFLSRLAQHNRHLTPGQYCPREYRYSRSILMDGIWEFVITEYFATPIMVFQSFFIFVSFN